MNDKIKKQLADIVGQHVRLVNESGVDMTKGKFHVHVCGRLQAPDEDGEYYVMVNDDPQGHGYNVISFHAENVSLDNGVFRQPSGIWEITLRG
jgi:hypothetical protein